MIFFLFLACYSSFSLFPKKTGEARHEHTQFAEVKRARDAVFDFGIHDCAFFAEVGSSVPS